MGKKPGNAVYSGALPALATGVRYYIIYSRRDKRPLAPGESLKLKLFIYSIHVAFQSPLGMGRVVCRIIGCHLRYVPLILDRPGMGECGNAGIKLGSFYFALGFFVWFEGAYGDLNLGHDLVGGGGGVYGGM